MACETYGWPFLLVRYEPAITTLCFHNFFCMRCFASIFAVHAGGFTSRRREKKSTFVALEIVDTAASPWYYYLVIWKLP